MSNTERVLAVHRTEGVVDVGAVVAGQGRELGREGGAFGVVLAGFAGVEAHVLQHQHLAVAQRRGGGSGAVARHVPGNANGKPARSRRRSAAGSMEYLGSGDPLGRPRWAITMTRAPASASFAITGRDARTRPSSVTVDAVERHVQVATDQDVPPADTIGEQFVESVRSHGSKPSR